MASVAGAIVLGGALAQAVLGSRSGSAVPSRRMFHDVSLTDPTVRPTQDGRHLLRYSSERRRFELVEVGSARTTVLTQLSGRDAWFRDCSLSPDGKQIAAVYWNSSDPNLAPSRERDGGLELRLYQVGRDEEGRVLSTWTEPGHNVLVFGWSPDRARVWVFVMRPDRAAEIVAVSVADGSRQVLRTLAFRNHSQTPSLSPDGKLIAYHDADSPQSPPDIFLAATDGSEPVRVEHPASDSKPLFTPDGSGVVFHSDRKGGNLWFLPLRGGRPAGEPRLVWADVGPYGVAEGFASNGSLIYFFRSNGWEIYRAEIDLGQRCRRRSQTRAAAAW